MGEARKRMLGPLAQECDSKRIESVTLYNPKHTLVQSSRSKRRIAAHHFIFFVAYMYQVTWMGRTIGVPYQEFVMKAEREGFEVMEGAAKMRAELKHSLADIYDESRLVGKVGWFDWMNMDIEEHVERKKREKEKSVLDALPKSMRVPGRYTPTFWSMLVTGVITTLHALVLLLQHWLVGFNMSLNYIAMDTSNMNLPDDDAYESWGDTGGSDDSPWDLSESGMSGGNVLKPRSWKMHPAELSHAQVVARGLPTQARIRPAKGRDVLMPVSYLPTMGATFEYHRRRFVWDSSCEIWSKVRCQTKMPLVFFNTWTGYENATHLRAACLRYGPNEFDVRQPTFQELYKAQLLSPFTVFQLFCVVLWMLDEYWQYSAFTLFMILTFEATVVFSRIKSLGALKGMGNKSRNVFVFRNGQWRPVESSRLLPGDIFSLTRNKPCRVEGTAGERMKNKVNNQDGDIVPADLLLMRGHTVVSEASLTGESVPQMKDGLVEIGLGGTLAMKTKDKNHVLYAGTKLLQCEGEAAKAGVQAIEDVEDEDEDVQHTRTIIVDREESEVSSDEHALLSSKIGSPPDHGCICFVLRTGFSSAQGKLVRMIEGSQEKVKGHEKETGLLLLLLFFFACASSGYVLKHGMENGNRSKYELLLHCILIITSVIPPELPMQMALAVNNSLMTLMKMQVFCTEPFRVPMAGKLDCCLFDKTGTLTTDELVAVGVYDNVKEEVGTRKKGQGHERVPTPMARVKNEAGLVIAGCHSLVLVDGSIVGDPLEDESLSSMRWAVSTRSGKVKPALPTEKNSAGKPLNVDGEVVDALDILGRHHFSSKLQRMSCLVKDNKGRLFVVAKGSPEAIGALLESCPPEYEETSMRLAKNGYRVISLAYKPAQVGSDENSCLSSRAHCEQKLKFAGFIAFTCRVRKDTKEVLNRLQEGGMSIAMITGDAILTAAYVAKEVGICDPDVVVDELQLLLKKNIAKRPLLLLEDGPNGLIWKSYDDDSEVEQFSSSNVANLASHHDLATTGKNLAVALQKDRGTCTILQHFKIFARMSPDEKETVIESLHHVGLTCLMCGDGANDVGALKQADVGVALLSGFGNANVDKEADGKSRKEDVVPFTALATKEDIEELRRLPVKAIKAKIRSVGVDPDEYPEIMEKEDLVKLYRIKASELAVKRHDVKLRMEKVKMTKAEMKANQQKLVVDKQAKMMERVRELEAQGESYAQFKAMKEFMSHEWGESSKKKKEMQKMNTVEGGAAMLAAQLDGLETGDLPMVKLGDASIAAPFTSKMPSIRSCVDIIRQGRCTLVTTIQMYQILALNCLISAYSLSVLYLDGVKYGDTQMTAMGILGSISYMSVSRSKPLDRLSSVRPLASIFHPSLFISLLGQFAAHLATMYWATRMAKQHMASDYEADLDGQFKPGILNSVVFLVSSVQQVTVFVVNLQGRPFMTGLTENRPLLWSLLATFIMTFMFASESVPGLNKYFQLVPFPDDNFRDTILRLLAADVLIAFFFDRIMKFIFCREILFASMKGWTLKDVVSLSKTIGILFAVMYTLLCNEKTWEELLREEDMLDGPNEVNAVTNETLTKTARYVSGKHNEL